MDDNNTSEDDEHLLASIEREKVIAAADERSMCQINYSPSTEKRIY
jgi:hypothetical protein